MLKVKKFLKKTNFFMFFFAMISLASGCGKNVDEIELNITDVINEMLSDIEFEDDLVPIDEEAILILYDIEPDIFIDCEVLVSANASADEIAIFRASEKSDIDGIIKAMEYRLTEQKMCYEEYLVEEMSKLDDAYIAQVGLYTILCVSNDNTKVKSIIQGIISGD